MLKNKTQGSLEYVILIGGVIILAAASYFMLRGFSQTTKGDSIENIGSVGDRYRMELQNLGRSEAMFRTMRWISPSLLHLTEFSFGCLSNPVFNTTNLTDQGIDYNQISFYCKDSSYCSLNYTIVGEQLTVNTTDSCCSAPLNLYMYYNNSSQLENACNLNFTLPCTLLECSSKTKTDDVAPTIDIATTAFGSSGSIRDADIVVEIDGTGSNVSEVYYSIEWSAWFPADNLYYQKGTIPAEAHPADNSYDSEYEVIHLSVTVLEAGEYNIRVFVRDEYGNEAQAEQLVNISLESGGYVPNCFSEAVLTSPPICGCDNPVLNLAENPGFESGLTGWEQHLGDNSIIGIKTNIVKSGLNSLWIQNNDTDAVGVNQHTDELNSISYNYYIPATSAENHTTGVIMLFNNSTGIYGYLYYFVPASGFFSDMCGTTDGTYYAVCPTGFSGYDQWNYFERNNISEDFETLLSKDWNKVTSVYYWPFAAGTEGQVYETYFDDIRAASLPEGEPCDSGNDDGTPDGVCSGGECLTFTCPDEMVFSLPPVCGCDTNTSGNYFSNPGFESGNDSWEFGDNNPIANITDSFAHSGSYSLVFNTSDYGSAHTSLSSVPEQLSFYVYLNATMDLSETIVALIVQFNNSTDIAAEGYYFFNAGQDPYWPNDFNERIYVEEEFIEPRTWHEVTIYPKDDFQRYFEEYNYTISSAVFGMYIGEYNKTDPIKIYFDDFFASAYPRGKLCDSDTAAGLQKGACGHGTCEPFTFTDFDIETKLARPADTINFSLSFVNYTPMQSCDLTVDGSSYSMSLSGSAATYSGQFPLGSYIANATCTDALLRTRSVTRDFKIDYWDASIPLSTGTGDNNKPDIATLGNQVHAVWKTYGSGGSHISYRRSTDNGATWSATTTLARGYDHHLENTSTILHLVHSDGGSIYYNNSSDGGITWSPGILLSSDMGSDPSMAVSGTDVHVISYRWTDRSVYYTNSSDNGVSWNPPGMVVNNSTNIHDEDDIRIAVSGNHVHLAWSGNVSGQYRLYYQNSSDRGTTWSNITILANTTRDNRLDIAASGQYVHVVFDRNGPSSLTYLRSDDHGANWFESTQIGMVGSDPKLFVSGSDVHLVYPFLNLRHITSGDNGVTWSDPTVLTNTHVQHSSVTAYGDYIHVVYEQYRSGNQNDTINYLRYNPD